MRVAAEVVYYGMPGDSDPVGRLRGAVTAGGRVLSVRGVAWLDVDGFVADPDRLLGEEFTRVAVVTVRVAADDLGGAQDAAVDLVGACGWDVSEFSAAV